VVELYTLFSRLPHLEVLDLSYNSLSVVTNNVTGNVNPNLRVLGLANSELTVFSEFLRAMKNLEVLDLAGNNIHGLIPDWAGEWIKTFVSAVQHAIKDVDKNPNGNHMNISGSSYSIIVPVNSEADWLA
ncbi:leucine-rich repeat-containing protein, partial [Tanacetum coccineum]